MLCDFSYFSISTTIHSMYELFEYFNEIINVSLVKIKTFAKEKKIDHYFHLFNITPIIRNVIYTSNINS